MDQLIEAEGRQSPTHTKQPVCWILYMFVLRKALELQVDLVSSRLQRAMRADAGATTPRKATREGHQPANDRLHRLVWLRPAELDCFTFLTLDFCSAMTSSVKRDVYSCLSCVALFYNDVEAHQKSYVFSLVTGLHDRQRQILHD